MKLVTSGIVTIDKEKITFNQETIFKNENNGDAKGYFKSIFKHLGCTYPKFYKMDLLTKLCFLAGELLVQKTDYNQQNPEQTAIILGNKSSSLDTDLKHLETISDKNNYLPSPAVFVYTLPNIMIGELCIRHNIKGNCDCILMEEYDEGFFQPYIHHLFKEKVCDTCITGWVNYEPENFYAALFLMHSV